MLSIEQLLGAVDDKEAVQRLGFGDWQRENGWEVGLGDWLFMHFPKPDPIVSGSFPGHPGRK